jgi:hypothetical protein
MKSKFPNRSLCAMALASLTAFAARAAEGYTDTPIIPGTPWHVHDPNRPQPPVVAPGTFSTPEQPGKPPSDALVLFDGTDLSHWRTGDGGPAGWKIEDGAMVVPPRGTPGGGDILTREEFGDCQLHLEWAAPAPARGSGQNRGNSGIFFMSRYELQVLDCYENQTYADGSTGAIYGQHPPLVNACRPPGQWQTYDVVFIAPRFEGETLKSPAYVTVFLNGVLVQHHAEVFGPTSHRRLNEYRPHASKAPLRLQDHGAPVRYRNIWIRSLASPEAPTR